MQFLVLFRPKQTSASEGRPADFEEVEAKEQAQTRVLHAQGTLRAVWAVEPKGSGAAVVFEADSRAHLDTIIQTFPLIQVGYADSTVSQLAPHPAFAPRP